MDARGWTASFRVSANETCNRPGTVKLEIRPLNGWSQLMASHPLVRFGWTRYWVRRGDSPRLENGYLVPPEGTSGWFGVEQKTELSTLDKLAEVPCLVLLGDVGLGKSVEIAREAERLRAMQQAEHRVLEVDLKRSSAEVIIQEVFQSAEFTGWLEHQHDLTLLFDSMDECWRRVTELGPLLLSHLKPHMQKEGRRKLAMRLSCRAAEWQDEIEAGLREVFGKDEKHVQVWQLAPLMKKDVHLAAAQCGLAAQDFVGRIEANDVTALAAHPITLRMLLDLAKADKALGKNREEIYAAGCELLCRDTHQANRAKARLETTAQQRFEHAAYVAAAGVLANRYLIFGSCDKRSVEETGVIAGLDLAGYWVTGNGQRRELDRTALEQTLQTGLFESQPNGFHTWRHQSYAEFLAARHLQERKLPVEQYAALLCDTATGCQRIWPQLEETACWLVTLVPALFQRLVVENADVFLRCDPARLGSNERKAIVRGYLGQVRRDEARTPVWNERVRLNRLAYDGIQQDLEPVIRNTCESWIVRDLAMDIARACELPGLQEMYLELFANPAEVKRVRASAGDALRDMADEKTKRKLKAVYSKALENDPDDQARGYVLQLLWPEHLSVAELLPLLTLPRKDNFIGAYKRFLSDLFVEGSAIADLPVLLRWVAKVEPNSRHLDNDPYDGLCARVALAAYHNLADVDVTKEFFALVTSMTRRDGVLFKTEGRDLPGEALLRQRFWREAIARGLPLKDLLLGSSLQESGVIDHGDLAWILAEREKAGTPELKQRWLDLAWWLYAPLYHPEHLGLMQPLADADPAVAEIVRQRTTDPLIEDDEKNWRKEHYYRELKKKEELEKRPTFLARIEEALGLYAEGKAYAMWWLMERLVERVREHDEEGHDSDIGWERITADQRMRIREAAPAYLAAIEVTPDNYAKDPKTTHRPYTAGLRLMVELAVAGSPWLEERSEVFWQRWTPVLFAYFDLLRRSDEEPWAKVFGVAHRKAPKEFYAGLDRWLTAREGRYTPLGLLDEVPVAEDQQVEGILLRAAVNAIGPEADDFELFTFLLGHDSKAAEQTMRSWQAPVGGAPHPRARMADALLLLHRTEVGGEAVLARMQADLEWGRTVLGYLNRSGSMRMGYLPKVSPEAVARFWEWLQANFPAEPYEDGHMGLVTLDHEIYHLRGAVLHFLENSGSDEALQAIGDLVRRHPDKPWLGQVLAKARHVRRRKEWVPPPAKGIVEYLRVPTQKPLCSDSDLCDALLASLGRYQAKLKQDNPVRELWNEPAGPVTTRNPKDEENISDCLARHLETDLASHKVTVVRESQLRPNTGTEEGNFPDLVAHAQSASDPFFRIKVPIEVKGTWHAKVVESVRTQLHDRYMLDARCGIHVTGYFTCDSWTNADNRKSRGVSRVTPDELLRRLQAERDRVMTTSGKRVEVLLLDARL